MNVLMSVDMEGATGVTGPEDTQPGTAAYERFRRLLMGDVNAAIDGAFDGGASEVLVNEGHDGMRNLLIEDLDERARLISGPDKPLMMMECIDRAVDLVFLIGYHAPAGESGVLSHTYLAPGFEVSLNGETCSEGRMNAVLAGAYGVGVGLITGDEAACADGAHYIAGVRTVAVKEQIDRYAAICLPPSRTKRMIREAAGMACQDPASHAPLATAPPFRWSVSLADPSSAQRASLIPGVERVDPRTVEWISHNFPESYRTFQAVALIVSAA